MPSTTLWLTWQQTAALNPHAPAVIEAHEAQWWTRTELTREALAIAACAPETLRVGQVVAFGGPNSGEWLAVFLALQKLGVLALPLDAALPAALRAAVAVTLGAHWLLEPTGNWAELSTSAARYDKEYCLIKTTSGSTGEPRPLAFTSANMLADGRQITVAMGIGPGDRNLGAIPFGHSYGLGNLVLPLVTQGTAVIASTEILPDALAAQVERFAATVFPSVPAVLRGLAESLVEPARLRTLRRVISAGAPLRASVAVEFKKKFGCPVLNFYGSSETGGICFDPDGEATATGRSVGMPLKGVEIKLDAEGRVTVRSPAVAPPGEHMLADLGDWNEQGELHLIGRAVPLANIGGKKVSPLEIERVLRGLDGVTDAWVDVRARSSGGGDYLLAAVETDRTGDEIRTMLTNRLPHWQMPRRLWTAPRLPRTERGKLDRRELEARCMGEPG